MRHCSYALRRGQLDAQEVITLGVVDSQYIGPYRCCLLFSMNLCARQGMLIAGNEAEGCKQSVVCLPAEGMVTATNVSPTGAAKGD